MITIPLQRGKHCFIYKNFKVFDFKEVDKVTEDILWGDDGVSLRETTKIQNICWLHGLAPRVRGVTRARFFNKIFMAQIVQVLAGLEVTQKEAEEVYNKIIELGKIYGFECFNRDISPNDVIDGKLIDFNTFRFTPDHLEKVKKIYIEKARYGKGLYNQVSEWGLLDAPRKNEERIRNLGLDKIDFKDKIVLDLGCDGGFITRYAENHEAKMVIGIDHKSNENNDPIFANYLLSNELEFWDIDYFDVDLSKDWDKKPADIVFYLSMNYHIDIPGWLPEVTKEVCIFEDNSKTKDAKGKLESIFEKVEFKGFAKDHGDKPIYYCYI